MQRVFLTIFLGVAALMLAITMITGISTARMIGGEVSTRGYVTGFVTRTDATGNPFYYPVVRFILPDGSRRSVQMTEGSWPSAYKVDEAVTVRYDPAQPHRARIATTSATLSLWIWTLVTGILGAAFLLAALLVRWVFTPD